MSPEQAEMTGLDIDTGWSWYGAESDANLESLRGDPEFEAIMDEIKRRVEDARTHS
jgi:hypothetical protein